METPFRPAHVLIGLCLALLLGSTSRAAPGDVDSLNANVDGYVHTTAVQPDGKTIIVGSFYSVLGTARNNIARLNADGTLDMAFNPNANNNIWCVAVQADGQIIFGGSFTSLGGATRNRIARVDANGVLDAGFNPNANHWVYSIAVQADGQILLGGSFTRVGGITRDFIARVATNGTLDASFNPSPTSTIYSLAVQADGQILLGGSFSSVSGIARNRIARVAANGTLNASFNPDVDNSVSSVAVQADGQILLGGDFTSVGGILRNRIARVDANGILDMGFKPNADSYIPTVSPISSVVVQANGQILLGGDFTSMGGAVRNHIARIAANGVLDAGFNPNANEVVSSIAVQADGRILLGGSFTSVGGAGRSKFARLLNDPATQTLSALDSTQVLWSRGGSAPEVTQTTFELSTDGGSSFTPLGGTATRGGSTAHWKLSGLSLPASGHLRARGRVGGGYNNSSSGLVEQVASFSGLETPASTITLVSPDSGNTAGGTSVTITGTSFTGATSVTFGGIPATSFTVDSATQITAITPAHVAGTVDVGVAKPEGSGIGTFLFTYAPPPTVTASTTVLPATATSLTIRGSGFSSTPGNNIVVFSPAGTGTVTAATATSLIVSGISGLTLGSLNAVVTTNGLSSGAAVQVATMVGLLPGRLDTLNANIDGNYVYASAMQPDGKIIIAGSFTSVMAVPRNNIARLNADGTLDMSFNPNANGTVSCVAVQADGPILLGGFFTSIGGTTRNRIARVAADGTLDLGFNPDANDSVRSVTVQADGQILLGGFFTSMSGTTHEYIARVTAGGTLDMGFNPGVNNNVRSVAIQADGQILLGGQFTSVGGMGRSYIARVDANGSLDEGFNPNTNSSVNSVVVQADRQILLGGSFTSVGGVSRNRIARIALNGTLDMGFNPNANDDVYSLAVQADGQILFGGDFTSIGENVRNRIARVAASGTLDMGFNPNADDTVRSVTVQADGRILLGGSFSGVGIEATRYQFARLLNDPAVQTLSAVDSTQVLWSRGGSAPEITQTAFELSTNSGSSYSPLGGTVMRAGSTSHWKLTGLNLPASGQLRARGRILGGNFNGSSGFVEQVVSFSGLEAPASTVTLVSPSKGNIAGGTSVTITGTNFTGATSVTFDGIAATSFTVDSATQITAISPAHVAGAVDVTVIKPEGSGVGTYLFTFAPPPTLTASTVSLPTTVNTTLTITGTGFSTTPGNNNTVLFTPTGTGTVTAATATSLTVTGISGLALGALNAVVISDSISSGEPVQVASVVVPGTGDASSLDANVVGSAVLATTVQPDGKTIIAGTFSSVLGVARNNIARFNPDGTLDVGFNPNANNTVLCVAVQADGQILLGGHFTNVGGVTRNYIARVAADGTLDVGFDPSTNHYVLCMSLQADGRILLGGQFTSVGGITCNYIARLNSGGTLDLGFNPAANGYVLSVVVQADGQILLGGFFTSVRGAGRNRIARVAANGTLDTGFNPNANSNVYSLVVQADGQILLGGSFTTVGGTSRSRIARVAADGTLDAGFNPSANSSINSMAVQADGQILLGGSFTSVGGIGRKYIARVAADGSLDEGFKPDVDIGVAGVAVQADGQILLGGFFTTVGATGRNKFARLLNDPAAQTLSALDYTQVMWSRGGSAPEVTQTTFELSTNGGSSYTSLGKATRVGSSANWQLTGLYLPPSGQLRARGRTAGSYYGGSSGMVEQVVVFSGLPIPDIAVAQASPLTDGTGSFAFISTTLGSSTPLTFTISNPSQADLNSLVVSKDGPDATDFTVSALSATSIPAGSGTSIFTVTFSPKSGGTKTAALHIASNVVGAKNPFDITLTGIGRVTSQASQTIAFMPPTKLYLAEGPLTLSASTSSGLPVTFTVVSGPATVQGNVMTFTGPGTVKLRASQPGDSDFLAATSVERSITVAANPTALTLTDLNQTYTGTPRPITVLGAAGPVDVTYKVGSSFVSDAPIDVGSYPVKAGAKTGTLVITKAPLFVQPYDQRKFAGQANPVLGFGYSGFFGADNAANSVSKAPVIATTATATSAGGLYPITASGGTSTNYLFVYQKGTMMVETFAASYEAMLVDADSTRPSAKLELTVAASSKAFTGKLTTPTETTAVALKGTLTTDTLTEIAAGTATVKKGANTYLVTVTLPLAGDFTAEAKLNGAVIGHATNGQKLLTLAKGQTLSYIGTHSALLAPATGGGAPAGAGWAVATIDAKGLLKLTGKLADGSNLTASLAADVGSNPGYRLFIQPYTPARTEAFMAGTFALKPQTDEGLTGRRYVAFEDEADFTWVKAPRLQDSSYRAGIGPVDTRFTLDPWLPPIPAKGLVPAITLAQRLGLTANQFTAQHSTISSASFGDIPLTLALSATNAVSVIAPATTPANKTKWKVTLTPATGAFVGSFELNDAGKKRLVPFTGMMRQPPSTDTSGLIGNGNFQLPSLSPAPNNEILSGEVGFER